MIGQLPPETNCGQSDASGAYRVAFPANMQVLISFNKGGYLSSLEELTTSASDRFLGGHTLITQMNAMDFATSLLDPIDSSKPIVTVQVNGPGGMLRSGATVSAAFNPATVPSTSTIRVSRSRASRLLHRPAWQRG